MSDRKVFQSRSLFDPDKATQLPWTAAVSTDLRAKFLALKREKVQKAAANVTQIKRQK
jgi:hypothetical protein